MPTRKPSPFEAPARLPATTPGRPTGRPTPVAPDHLNKRPWPPFGRTVRRFRESTSRARPTLRRRTSTCRRRIVHRRTACLSSPRCRFSSWLFDGRPTLQSTKEQLTVHTAVLVDQGGVRLTDVTTFFAPPDELPDRKPLSPSCDCARPPSWWLSS